MARLQRWRRRSSAAEVTGPGGDQTVTDLARIQEVPAAETVSTPKAVEVTDRDDAGPAVEPDVQQEVEATPAKPRWFGRLRRREASYAGGGAIADPDDGDNSDDTDDPVDPAAQVIDEPDQDLPNQDEPDQDRPVDEEAHDDAEASDDRRRRRRIADSYPSLLLRTAHPRQMILTALVMALAAALTGRALREVGVIFATVLVGQAILGWHNDLTDVERDELHQTPGKPIAEGRLEPGSAWYAVLIALLLVIPLSMSTGITAGVNYLVALIIGVLGNLVLRKGIWSWVPWALSFALLPAFLTYGGWGGSAEGQAPHAAVTALTALLGVGVHLLRSIWGLVDDNEDGWRSLPLRLGLRFGATRLLYLSLVYTVLVLIGLAVVTSQVGLTQ